ncbi:MAG: biotin/lipoyl-binding protein [Myxococcales bacterium]|nr:MAG: biotin/lipoyl-binding protein [Myxococcales bacterium]
MSELEHTKLPLGEVQTMNAVELVPPPGSAKPVAKTLALAMLIFFVTCLVAPWQQNVQGSGQVMAYVPNQRQQQIEATIDGRVARWFVNEGDKIKAGEPVVELADNDALIPGSHGQRTYSC